MSAQQCQLVIGLPGAGKTTFLAALRHVTEAGDVDGSLRLHSLGHDDGHVNRVRNTWIGLDELQRTPHDQEQLIRVRLCDAGSNACIDLDFPDLSGELIEHQWSLRRCTPTYAELAARAEGVLLFIHPDRVATPTPIADANVVLDALAPLVEDAAAAQEPASEYQPERAATQVKLVELLQIVLSMRTSDAILPVAIIVSAWDRVDAGIVRFSAPAAWVAKRLPLVDQFLAGNPERICARMFGLSAQGGDRVVDRERLLAVAPSERIRLVTGDSPPSHDITLPVRWIRSVAGAVT